jgi:Sugar-transfer associated ATP-grasp
MPSGEHPLVNRGATTPLGGQRRHDFLDRLGRASFKEAFPDLAEKFWRRTIAILELINKERKYIKVSGLPFVTRLAMWRQGFLSESFTLYQLDSPDLARAYLSDLQRHAGIWGINEPFENILDNKLIFWGFLRNFSSEIAQVVGFIQRNAVYSFMDLHNDPIPIEMGSLNKLGYKLIVKPLSASGGLGIALYEWRDNAHYLNGERCTADKLLDAFAKGQYIVCTFVDQAAYAARIFPGTANSIRILTLYDSERRECFIAAAAHRFGIRSGSKLVDNWVQGGVAAGVDLATGRLAKAYAFPRQGRLIPHTHHPDTDELIEGAQITNWPQIKNGIVALGSKLPFLPHVGWDVIATDEGFVIIEGNNRPAVNIIQLSGPLLADPRVAEFYRQHGVL